MKTVEELENLMTEPSDALVEDMRKIDGNLLILGIGGKMGPTLAMMAKRAIDKAGLDKKVIGVSRFSNGTLKEDLEKAGIETISTDLLDDEHLKLLPKEKNIIYMAGNKFGTTGNEHFTWAMNTYLPGRVAEHFKGSNIVAFSTGNVYPLVPLTSGGCDELHEVAPVGEYGQSSLGRERVFTYFSHKDNTPLAIFRLNYAIDMRYGVLLEIARSVNNGVPLDLSMGHVNVIWQGDANEYALRSLLIASSPPTILNVTGPETLPVRWLANEFGKLLGKTPIFDGVEKENALLNNASKAHKLFGYPRVSIREMIEWTADWVANDGETINKPTHFQERKGQF
ncbi:NAD-dependent epimerase/dehydratase family protein [Psychrobacillus psychrodurans]|uniref:NAD(P)-dependent oxidoreductase n=1 Tax=Psychrobacillus psychrodurans TaxID=126157 RepID=A0A9X3R856_9BACI|nr:NAD(P)-dependent oxidoreductase [Psychrobacillus psychrodurans]MCZ8531959.1 NAD(P)-dependent oxidoreductase [Psychrobacillus psychrodurans]